MNSSVIRNQHGQLSDSSNPPASAHGAARPRFPPGSSEPFVDVFATPSDPNQEQGLTLHIHVREPRESKRKEAYINVYTAELDSPGRPWTPEIPITYPSLYSRAMPFHHALSPIRTTHAFVGVLISLCDPGHREIDWCCRVFRVQDGAEVLDRRRRR